MYKKPSGVLITKKQQQVLQEFERAYDEISLNKPYQFKNQIDFLKKLPGNLQFARHMLNARCRIYSDDQPLFVDEYNAHKFEYLVEVHNSLIISCDFSAPYLTKVTGTIRIEQHTDLPKSKVNLPELVDVEGALLVHNSKVSVPRLLKVGSHVGSSCTLNLPWIASVGGNLTICGNCYAPHLLYVAGGILPDCKLDAPHLNHNI